MASVPRLMAFVFGALGALLYALLAFGVLLPQPTPAFGSDLYDAYFYRLGEGRFDLPMRMLRSEGHYAPDGTGILYHGIAPLLTRAMLAPFVTLNTFPTAAFSVWFWAVLGTCAYHALVFQVVRKYAGAISAGLSAFIAIAVWIPSPGLFLTSSLVVYHEPMSVAFAASAGVVYLLLSVALLEMPVQRALIPIAVLAALALHARPHVAVGIYAGLVLLIGLALHAKRLRALPAAGASILILGFAGVSFLLLNDARFGSAFQTHGAISQELTDTGLAYGPVFFGSNYAVDGRGVVFEEHGRFHLWRVLPTAMVYTFDAPAFSDRISATYLAVTTPISGRGHVEAPHFGIVFIWPVWLLAAIVGVIYAPPKGSALRSAAPALIATGVAALFILSYPTVAFRYRSEVWPLLIVVAVLCFPSLVGRFGSSVVSRPWVMRTGVTALAMSVAIAASVVQTLTLSYRTSVGGKYETWTFETCSEQISHHDFSAEDVARICIDPESVWTSSNARG